MLFLLLNSSFIKDIKQGNKLSVQALTGIIKKGEAVSSSIKNAHIGSMRKQILEIVRILEAEPNLFDTFETGGVSCPQHLCDNNFGCTCL